MATNRKKIKNKLEHYVDAFDWYLLWILIGIISFIPLITRTAQYQFISPIISGSILDTGMKSNVFTYYKFILLVISVIILLAFFVYKIAVKGYQIKASYINKPFAVFVLLVLASGFMAPYLSIAMKGQFNQYEGTITYLCYFALFFIAANIVYNEKMLRYLLYAVYPLAAINAFLGVVYFYGYDLLNVPIIFDILFPDNIPKAAVKAGAAFNSTLYNPNYVSGIGAVLVVLFLAKAIFDSNNKQKVINVIFSVISFAMMLSSLSTSGFVTFVIVLPLIILAILFSKNKKNGFITLLTTIILFSATFTIMNNHNTTVWNESMQFFISADNTAQQVETKLDQKAITSKDEFNLPQPGVGPGSGRLYIWQKTIDLIKEKPLFGYGLNTIGYFFYQDDPQKVSNLSDYRLILDKPHNFYLDLGFGSGVIALTAFLVLVLLHIYKNLKIYIKGIDTEIKAIGVSFFLAVCAYLVQGLFNDSIICTAPVFWIIFGASAAIVNQINSEKEQEVIK